MADAAKKSRSIVRRVVWSAIALLTLGTCGIVAMTAEPPRPTAMKATEVKVAAAHVDAGPRTPTAAELRTARDGYAAALRNQFLDSGLDIKVRVTGRDHDHMALTYALFGDVWTRRFQTHHTLDEAWVMGFKRVDLRDGFGHYHSWFTAPIQRPSRRP